MNDYQFKKTSASACYLNQVSEPLAIATLNAGAAVWLGLSVAALPFMLLTHLLSCRLRFSSGTEPVTPGSWLVCVRLCCRSLQVYEDHCVFFKLTLLAGGCLAS